MYTRVLCRLCNIGGRGCPFPFDQLNSSYHLQGTSSRYHEIRTCVLDPLRLFFNITLQVRVPILRFLDVEAEVDRDEEEEDEEEDPQGACSMISWACVRSNRI